MLLSTLNRHLQAAAFLHAMVIRVIVTLFWLPVVGIFSCPVFSFLRGLCFFLFSCVQVQQLSQLQALVGNRANDAATPRDSCLTGICQAALLHKLGAPLT